MEKKTDSNTFYGTGRRKSSNARVWIFKDQKGFQVNGLTYDRYFQRSDLKVIVEQPLQVTDLLGKFRIRANVAGGGTAGQAYAVRLGIARALVAYDEKLKESLRRSGLMTRDPREKERKKPGRKGARRRFQYTKR